MYISRMEILTSSITDPCKIQSYSIQHLINNNFSQNKKNHQPQKVNRVVVNFSPTGKKIME